MSMMTDKIMNAEHVSEFSFLVNGNMTVEHANWLYFCPWYNNFLTSQQINPVESLVEIYTSDYCITLDELPDFRTYSISDTTTVTTAAPEELKGDANCDEKIDLADAVLTLQSIANPDKYGADGTDESHITAQGLINADCSGGGDGVTASDALAIQKYILKLIPSLPEE